MDMTEKPALHGPTPIPTLTTKPAPSAPPLHATTADHGFALFSMFLGYFFIRSFLDYDRGPLFGYTVLFAVAVLVYALTGKKISLTAESLFWLTALLILGCSMLQSLKDSLEFIRLCLLFFVAVYWVVVLFQGQIQGKTGDYLAWDLLNCFVLVPIGNLAAPILGMKGSKKLVQSVLKKRAWPVLLTIVVLIPVLGLIIPRLLWADEGNFSSVMDGIVQTLRLDVLLQSVGEELRLATVLAIAWIPAAFYIGGLVMGYAHRRRTSLLPLSKLEQLEKQARLCPNMTTIGVLGVTSGLYLLFLITQTPYYFSAFQGVLPSGIDVYSEYARSGFFELCQIAGINLALTTVLNILSKTPTAKQSVLKAANVVLMVLTLLILMTACSKMVLYINVLGLTPARIFTLVIMTWLACVCIAVILRQWKKFSLGRFGLILGVALLTLFFISNTQELSNWYNIAVPYPL